MQLNGRLIKLEREVLSANRPLHLWLEDGRTPEQAKAEHARNHGPIPAELKSTSIAGKARTRAAMAEIRNIGPGFVYEPEPDYNGPPRDPGISPHGGCPYCTGLDKAALGWAMCLTHNLKWKLDPRAPAPPGDMIRDAGFLQKIARVLESVPEVKPIFRGIDRISSAT